jgi:3-oxoacyl-[acyl-carrier protein] reductase
MRMANRLALVGGSSAGIGRAIAEGLLKKGFDVVLIARGAERLTRTQEDLARRHPGSKVQAVTADFASAASVSGLIESVRKNSAVVDVLVLNGGGPKAGTFGDLTLEDWDAAYQQQFRSYLALLKAFVPPMRSAKWGRVINVSSTVMLEPTPGMILSAGYRALLANTLKALSIDAAPEGVTVNTVCPGAVMTERLQNLLEGQASKSGKTRDQTIQETSASIPIRRIASPEEFAQLAVFLSGDEAAYITGAVIPVDGGLVKKSF